MTRMPQKPVVWGSRVLGTGDSYLCLAPPRVPSPSGLGAGHVRMISPRSSQDLSKSKLVPLPLPCCSMSPGRLHGLFLKWLYCSKHPSMRRGLQKAWTWGQTLTQIESSVIYQLAELTGLSV